MLTFPNPIAKVYQVIYKVMHETLVMEVLKGPHMQSTKSTEGGYMNGALRNSRKGEQTSGDPLVSYPIINLGPTTSHVLPKPNHQALQLSSFFSSLYTKERIPVCFRDTFLNWVFPNTGISVSSRQLDFLEDHVSLGYAFGFNWFHLLHMI